MIWSSFDWISRLRHAENRAVKKNILHAREVRVEAGGDLDQGRKAPIHNHAALGGPHDAAQNLQCSAFPGAVAANDAERFPVL